MQLNIRPDADQATRSAGVWLQAAIARSIGQRGRCSVAISGGSTSGALLEQLGTATLPWNAVDVFQVDERIAPPQAEARNLRVLARHLAGHAGVRIHPMPVESDDLDAAAARYQSVLRRVCGTPPVLDVVHLGLGADGHTASLIPGDAALRIVDADVALTAIYQSYRRMTLTMPVLRNAGQQLWLVTGAVKADALHELLRAGPRDSRRSPAAQAGDTNATVFIDESAAGPLRRHPA